MNERIYELVLQAEMAANQGDHVDVKIMMAKFGALIIKECITLGTNFTNRNYSDDAGERIAKHFGVEE